MAEPIIIDGNKYEITDIVDGIPVLKLVLTTEPADKGRIQVFEGDG